MSLVVALLVAALGPSDPITPRAAAVSSAPAVSRVVPTIRTPALNAGRFHIRATRMSATTLRVSMRLQAHVRRGTTLALFALPCVASAKAKSGFTCAFSLRDGKARHLHTGSSPDVVTVMAHANRPIRCVQVQLDDDEYSRGFNLLGPHHGNGVTLCPSG